MTKHALGLTDRGVELPDRADERLAPWMDLPRIATRFVDGRREFIGICRTHGWLALPAFSVQDVAHCPVCSDPGFTRFEAARRNGLV